MSEYKVSIRYSSSLLETAISKNLLEITTSDVQLILRAFDSSSELVSVIESPVVKGQLKISILEEIFKEKINDDTLNFLKFVVRKGRENFLINILEKFLDLKDEHLGIVNVDVKTAYEFDENQSNTIQKNLEKKLNKQVRINYTIDKTILGGFIAKIGDTMHDASIKHQLEQLQKKFTEGGVTLN